jgi:hypothetical protein
MRVYTCVRCSRRVAASASFLRVTAALLNLEPVDPIHAPFDTVPAYLELKAGNVNPDTTYFEMLRVRLSQLSG